MSAHNRALLANLSSEEYFKLRSKTMAIEMLNECYGIVADEEIVAPFTQKLDFLKTVAKFGDLEPKQNAVSPGTGFSIRIVYSGTDEKVVSGVTIEELPETPGYIVASPATVAVAKMIPGDPSE